jgi:hypothetical protein
MPLSREAVLGPAFTPGSAKGKKTLGAFPTKLSASFTGLLVMRARVGFGLRRMA